MSLLHIAGLYHSFGDGLLFAGAELVVNRGEHIGVVGQNGAGKSTLVKICTGQLVPDKGLVAWQPGVRVGYLDQYAQVDAGMTVGDFLISAFAQLYTLENEMNVLYRQAADGDLDALGPAARCQEQLEARDFYTIDTRIGQVVSGLGLHSIGLDRPIERMSGGQRAKVILAKLLLEQPDVMILDEPTNFLDRKHTAWLGAYLAELENAFLVVSHDTALLEKTASHICDISHGAIAKYRGTHSQFLDKKARRLEDHTRQYAAQQREIKRTEEFIRRNIAGRKSKMARGRQKQLERMEKLDALELGEIRPVFRFADCPVPREEHVTVSGLTVGYGQPVLEELDFSIAGGQKAVVTGFNGAGKSTLLKTLTGELAPLRGSCSFSAQTAFGYFAQDLAWQDARRTPIEVVSGAYPALSHREVRRELFRCGISARHAAQEVGTLSGGEQAKLKLCLLALRPCNLLLLDEPTNHLDRQAKEALQAALAGFPGTVLLVCHETAFYRDWAHREIDVEKGAPQKHRKRA